MTYMTFLINRKRKFSKQSSVQGLPNSNDLLQKFSCVRNLVKFGSNVAVRKKSFSPKCLLVFIGINVHWAIY